MGNPGFMLVSGQNIVKEDKGSEHLDIGNALIRYSMRVIVKEFKA